jgi:UDP-N-acetylglucosamine--N-acetylmuramyl-(pentapeptide) pyrophosphoryl-undecaprenol N-acetylglucosamine transferase
VIFVTVGSHPTYKFQRLIDAVATLSTDRLVVQHGPADPPPEGIAVAHRWLTFAEVLSHMQEAETVISHAGIGTILCAHNIGHTPIVMPRLQRFGETVDDHQVEIATLLERTGEVSVAWNPARLAQLASRPSAGPQRAPSPTRHALAAAVRGALRGEMA